MNANSFAALLTVLSLACSATASAAPHLLDSGDVLATRVRLVTELQGLEDSRPSQWVGRGLMLGGAVGIGGGLLIAWGGSVLFTAVGTSLAKDLYGLIFGGLGAAIIVFAGAIVALAAAVVLIIGIVKSLRTMGQRMEHDQRIVAAAHRLEEFDRLERPMSLTLPYLAPTYELMTF